MSERKKRRSDPSFKADWELNFFFVAVNANAKCLICSRIIAGHRKFPIERHYNAVHKEEFASLSEEERVDKLKELKENLSQAQGVETMVSVIIFV